MYQNGLQKINYNELNPRQQEYFNFHQVAAILATYGFACHWINDDWEGADFIALNLNGHTLKVQLKSRITFSKKYQGKGLHIAFPDKTCWYMFPHDTVLETLLRLGKFQGTKSWDEKGEYHIGQLSKEISNVLAPYGLGSINISITRIVKT